MIYHFKRWKKESNCWKYQTHKFYYDFSVDCVCKLTIVPTELWSAASVDDFFWNLCHQSFQKQSQNLRHSLGLIPVLPFSPCLRSRREAWNLSTVNCFVLSCVRDFACSQWALKSVLFALFSSRSEAGGTSSYVTEKSVYDWKPIPLLVHFEILLH